MPKSASRPTSLNASAVSLEGYLLSAKFAGHSLVATGAAKPVIRRPAAERIVSTRAAGTSFRFSGLGVALPTRLDTLSSIRAILEFRYGRSEGWVISSWGRQRQLISELHN